TGQITFSDPALRGPVTLHVAKHCFESTSFVAFDASNVTIFLLPWLDPSCADPSSGGTGGGGGVGKARSVGSGALVWKGSQEFGPNPWSNVPPPRENEVRSAYVFATQASVDAQNPDPSASGGIHRVLEARAGKRGYPFRIFVRPAAMAVYAIAGLET